jgi:tRNA A-37 threonylcarbamoyl transferase component Bud32
MPDDDFESRVLGFERAWQRNAPPEITDYLEPPGGPSGTERRRLLVELIAVDLEFRWRDGSRDPGAQQGAMLESYAARFPELGSLEEWPLELIGEEYRVRRRWGDRPSHADFLLRFAARREPIQAELARIDHELEQELADPRLGSLLPGRTSPPETWRDPTLDGPLVSHRDILLRRMIGAGRMGKVYEAWQHSARRAVAVKFLRKSFLHQPWVVHRFLGEARTIARLQHPNIVAIHGLGRAPGGAYFLVMELVAGPNLAHLSRSRLISVPEAISWAIATCNALEHAHARGIIHCDLKPANLLLDGDGRLRVTDFGLARSLSEETPWTAEIEGTAPFMAPEQASRRWGPIDERTDVYGIGAVLYTLLTGRPPWMGRRLPDILADVISAAPVLAPTSLRPDLPTPLSELCRKCLSKPPGERYHTVREVRSALAGLIGTRESPI